MTSEGEEACIESRICNFVSFSYQQHYLNLPKWFIGFLSHFVKLSTKKSKLETNSRKLPVKVSKLISVNLLCANFSSHVIRRSQMVSNERKMNSLH